MESPVTEFTHYITSDQSCLDFATYSFRNNITILIGGGIPMDKAIIIDKEALERLITGNEELDYKRIQGYCTDLEGYVPLSKFSNSIIKSYKYGNRLINEGMEPAIIISNSGYQNVPYIFPYILGSGGEIRSLKLKNNNKNEKFGVAIYGDEQHVSSIITKGDLVYVFDSIGNLHQKKDRDGIFKIDPNKINETTNKGKVVSLNPFGLEFQKENSDAC